MVFDQVRFSASGLQRGDMRSRGQPALSLHRGSGQTVGRYRVLVSGRMAVCREQVCMTWSTGPTVEFGRVDWSGRKTGLSG